MFTTAAGTFPRVSGPDSRRSLDVQMHRPLVASAAAGPSRAPTGPKGADASVTTVLGIPPAAWTTSLASVASLPEPFGGTVPSPRGEVHLKYHGFPALPLAISVLLDHRTHGISGTDLLQAMTRERIPEQSIATLEISQPGQLHPFILHPFLPNDRKRVLVFSTDKNELSVLVKFLPMIHVSVVKMRLRAAAIIEDVSCVERHSVTSLRCEAHGMLYAAIRSEMSEFYIHTIGGLLDAAQPDFLFVGEAVHEFAELCTRPVKETPESRSWKIEPTEWSDKKSKLLVREGIPDARRHDAWLRLLLVDSPAAALEDAYKNAFRFTFHIDLEWSYVPMHVPSFGKDRVCFEQHALTRAGVYAAKRVLCVFAENNPRITYCPALPDFLCILLMFLSEAETYAALCQVIKRSEQNGWYFRLGRESRLVSLRTVGSLLGRESPRLLEHMQKTMQVDPADVAGEFFDRLFFTFVPVGLNLQIIDAFLLEGSKVLYRYVVAALCMMEQNLLNVSSSKEALKRAAVRGVFDLDPAELCRRAFRMQLARSDLREFDDTNRQMLDPAELAGGSLHRIYIAPKFPDECRILPRRLFEYVWSWLSDDFVKLARPQRVFFSQDDGYSLGYMLHKCAAIGPHLLVLRDKVGHIFGACVSDGWRRSSSFYGTGTHAFLFSFSARSVGTMQTSMAGRESPDTSPDTSSCADSAKDRLSGQELMERDARVYRWQSGERGNMYIQQVKGDQLIVGAGGEGFGLTLDQQMFRGTTARCATFDNDPLCTCEEGRFEVSDLEIFALSQ